MMLLTGEGGWLMSRLARISNEAAHLVGIDKLQQLRVLLAQLREHRLQDLRVLLHHRAQPLELLVLAQEGQLSPAAAATAATEVRHALQSMHNASQWGSRL